MTATPVRALVVDDEPLAIDRIRAALDPIAEVELVGACAGGEEAVGAIERLRPDLVFLDVQMPGLDGFDVIEAVGPAAMPEVVFVTAYDEHALRAFQVHAVDYLLKPFDEARFDACVRRAVEAVRTRATGELEPALRRVLDALGRGASGGAGGKPAITKLLVRRSDHLYFVAVDHVDWFEAAGNYVCLHVGKDRHLIRTSLTELATHLEPTSFVRIHRSTIVNVRRVREVRPWGAGDHVAILEDGRTLRVSRTYRDALLQTFL